MNNYSFFCSKIMLGGIMENLFQKLNEFINEYDGFIIMGHKDPDLDSLGSSLGLCEIIETANNQVKDIKLIESIGGMDLLDDKTRLAATYRMKYKEASLLELSEIISMETKTPITKSGLHHRFTKIKQIANKIRNNE